MNELFRLCVGIGVMPGSARAAEPVKFTAQQSARIECGRNRDLEFTPVIRHYRN
jgi:hypothetical protein